jgi:peptidoglycan/xylan/chitin deacetylase (PgdA/CDA1 family)
VFAAELPLLPLLLWETPPGLEMILGQAGIPFAAMSDPNPLAFSRGRFVLYDGRRIGTMRVRSVLSPAHTAIDIDGLRQGESIDPFSALVDTQAAYKTWRVGRYAVSERVARYSRARIRRAILKRLREAVTGSGGLWARLGAYPHPYRSAFNFRADLDEPYPDDYARFAQARRPIDDCSTHFISTHAYGRNAAILGDLAHLDPQSHAHFHVLYKDANANRRNIDRAHDILRAAGMSPVGFAGPEGRWNAAVDGRLEELGYQYSSDFQLGYDDVPFFPWKGDRFSSVLQLPIHPICEGLFLNAGAQSGRDIGDYFTAVIGAKTAAGQPAFLYGHPERRLGRFPEILHPVVRAVSGVDLLWRVTLTEFARWWKWRLGRRWSLVARGENRYEMQLDDWDTAFPLALEVTRGDHVAALPVQSSRMRFALADLVYERRRSDQLLPEPGRARGPRGLRSTLKRALDYETVTPLDELPETTLAARLKKQIRRWKSKAPAESEGVS